MPIPDHRDLHGDDPDMIIDPTSFRDLFFDSPWDPSFHTALLDPDPSAFPSAYFADDPFAKSSTAPPFDRPSSPIPIRTVPYPNLAQFSHAFESAAVPDYSASAFPSSSLPPSSPIPIPNHPHSAIGLFFNQRSPSPASEGCLSSPGLSLSSISPADTSLSPPLWVSQLWDPSQYPPHAFKAQRYQENHHPLGPTFQPSSAPSPLQSAVPGSAVPPGYARRAESESVNDSRDATIRPRKRPTMLAMEDDAKDMRLAEHAPHKSLLKQPKLAPSAWQLYFTDWIQRHQATSMRKLNVAQAAKEAGQEYANLTPEQKEPYKQRSLVLKRAREQENEAYLRSLTPEDIKRENAFRTAQRKAGRSRKSNLKDLNAPKKPLSAYFMFLQHIRSDRRLVRNIFGDEQETTKQSVLAAAKWRSMTDEERKPFLAQAEQEKLEYEAARRLYEDGTPGPPNTINFSILPGSPSDGLFRVIKSEPFGSESESDDGAARYTRF